MENQTWMWVIFAGLIASILSIDLGVLNRRAHAVSMKEAAGWCLTWVSLALLFGLWIYSRMGSQKALAFVTGYILECSLSVDNLFIFIVVFDYFSVPRQDQSRVLHWGILGAVAMRLVFIMAGIQLIHAFHWIVYVFGGVLIFTGLKMILQKDERIEPENNPLLRTFQRFMPISKRYRGNAFFVEENSLLHATPLFAALLVVEATDIVFAVDSIPTILAITTDRFIVYTSNMFAILGLRSFFFLLSGVLGLFRFLKIGISVILCFVGSKMLLADVWDIPIGASLGVVVGLLSLSVLASLLIKEESSQTP